MLDREQFSQVVKPVIEWVENYYQRIERLPVKSQVKPGEILKNLPASPPQQGESLEHMIADLDKVILPGITHWQHPNFHAYFPANTSVESLLGEIVTAAIGAQCMIWDTSPAAAELEELTMNWLKGMIGLPDDFEGVIQDSASSATLVAILSAREHSTNFTSNESGVPDNLRVYCSSETHSSVEKAVGIAGIGRQNLRKIKVDKHLALEATDLEAQIKSDLRKGDFPCCVVASLGTTGTCAMDPLKEIAEICHRYRLWLHVDAAYAGNALILPEYRYMLEGIESADSFVFNAHKWMFTHFDCSAYFVKSAETLIRTFEILPEYLRTSSRGVVNDYRDWGIPLGRRFRALKLWFVIRGFGVEGIQQKFREHIALNQFFASEIEKDVNFEVVVPPILNMCCFRYTAGEENQLNQLNETLLDTINKKGDLYLTHTKVHGIYCLRMVIGQTYVEQRHVEAALDEIRGIAAKLDT